MKAYQNTAGENAMWAMEGLHQFNNRFTIINSYVANRCIQNGLWTVVRAFICRHLSTGKPVEMAVLPNSLIQAHVTS